MCNPGYKYTSIDLIVGTTVPKVVNNEVVAFHQKVADCFLGEEPESQRTGNSMQLAITQSEWTHDKDSLDYRLQEEISLDPIDLTILDVSSNFTAGFFSAYLYCLSAFDAISNRGSCHAFLIYAREFPSDLPELFSSTSHNIIIVGLSTTGSIIQIAGNLPPSCNTQLLSKLASEHRAAFLDSPLSSLKRKCIIRRGHFSKPLPKGEVKCTETAIHLRDVEKELVSLIKQWALIHAGKFDCVVYDAAANQDARRAITCVFDDLNIACQRADTVAEREEALTQFKQFGKILLVVDYWNSGTRALNIWKQMKEEYHLNMQSMVLAVVAKSGGSDCFQSNGLTIHSLMTTETDQWVPSYKCPQCACGYSWDDWSREADEAKIRSYTMYRLVETAGWEDEPLLERPQGRRSFPVVPNFEKILEMAGSWIAYKFYKLIRGVALQKESDYLILHPAERDACRIADLINGMVGTDLPFIAVERQDLDFARKLGNNWKQLIDEGKLSHRDWFKSLASARAKFAIVIDVFYSSGSTLEAFLGLGKHFSIPIAEHIVLIDFSPFDNQLVKRSSLYQWHHPFHRNQSV